jgi:hypothetical protein
LHGMVMQVIRIGEGNERIEIKKVARTSRLHSQPL